MRLIALCVAALFGGSLIAQSPLGQWKTTDDETGEDKSWVEIYEENGVMYGKVTKILTDRPDALCEKCKGDKYNQPVLGLIIIEDLKKSGAVWKGKILDPEKGAEYRLVSWIESEEPDVLYIRGKHWTGLYRTQTWNRL